MGKHRLNFLFLAFFLVLLLLPGKMASAQTSTNQCQPGATKCKNGFTYKCVTKKTCSNNTCYKMNIWEKTSTLCALSQPSPTTAGGGAIPSPTSASSANSGLGKIVLSGNPDGQDTEIFIMDENGQNLRQLTNNSANDQNASFSPDGQKIVFASERDGNREIYLMNADGTNQTRLTNNPAEDHRPSFAPNGQTILFSSNQDGKHHLYTIDQAGNNLHTLPQDASINEQEGVYSPNGQYIAYNGIGNIYLMNADGTGKKPLATSAKNELYPSFSRDSKQVVFTKGDSSNRNIVRINVDGSSLQKLTNQSKFFWNPSYSPDGGRIIFYQSSDAEIEQKTGIFTMKPDGTDIKTLLAGKYAVSTTNVWINPQAVAPPTVTLTPSPTASPSPTPYPNITAPAYCALRTKGDATCDNLLDDYDLDVWACQISNKPGLCIGQENRSADFNLKDGVDLNDFEIWRENTFPLAPGTMAPTQAPAELVNLANPQSLAGKTMNEACQAYKPGYACTARCTLMSAIKYQAYYMMTENPSSTTSDNNCSQVVPNNVTYLSACCYQQPLMSVTVTPTEETLTATIDPSPTIAPNPPTEEPEPTVTPTLTPVPTLPITSYYKVFVVEKHTNPNNRVDRLNGNLGGLAGADRICQEAADNVNFTGTYKAWLSTASTKAIDRVRPSISKPYYLPDGETKVADNLSNFANNSLLNPINTVLRVRAYTTEITTEITTDSSSSILTGTRVRADWSNPGYCNDWTSSADSITIVGNSGSKDVFWTDQGSGNCASVFSGIYCFQVN